MDLKFLLNLIIGATGILILLEATRRAIGLPLVIIAVCFLLFSYFGKYAPDIISHGGLSVKRLVGFQWFDQEAIFGIPIGVSVDFIFLFVLFGALLETAGGGKYFLDLAFAMVGKMRGGPAKAAILGSGMTGMISGFIYCKHCYYWNFYNSYNEKNWISLKKKLEQLKFHHQLMVK